MLLALDPSGLAPYALADIHWVEVLVFLGALYLLRKRHPSAIAVIFGSGVVGTAAYALLGVL